MTISTDDTDKMPRHNVTTSSQKEKMRKATCLLYSLCKWYSKPTNQRTRNVSMYHVGSLPWPGKMIIEDWWRLCTWEAGHYLFAFMQGEGTENAFQLSNCIIMFQATLLSMYSPFCPECPFPFLLLKFYLSFKWQI